MVVAAAAPLPTQLHDVVLRATVLADAAEG